MKRIDNDFTKNDFTGFDNIKASRDLKRKVYAIIEEDGIKANKAARYRKNFSYLRWIASAAACIIFLCSVLAWGLLKPAGKLPGTSSSPDTNPTHGNIYPSPDLPVRYDLNEIYIWWDSDEVSRNVINTAIDDFKGDYPNKNITFKVYTPSSQDRLALEMNIVASTAPDIVRMSYLYMFSLLQKGHIENLADSKYGAGELKEKFHESAWKAVSRDDKIWGLPFDMSTMVMGYNKDLLNKVGMDIPKNYDEMVELWERVSTLGDDYYGYSCDDESRSSIFTGRSLLLFFNMGGSFLSEDWTSVTINSKESIEAFESMLEIRNKKGVSNFYRDGDFEPGKLAMLEIGPWWIDGIKNNEKFVIGTIPEFKKGVTPRSFLGLYALGIVSKPSKYWTMSEYYYKHSVSYDFIKYFTTNAKYQYDFCLQKNMIPSLLEAQNMAPYNEGVHKVFVDQLKSVDILPAVEIYPDIEAAYLNALSEVYNSQSTPKEALDRAAEIINKLLKDYNDKMTFIKTPVPETETPTPESATPTQKYLTPPPNTKETIIPYKP